MHGSAMMRRAPAAVLLVLTMLSAGCLGMLGGEDAPEEPANEAPEVETFATLPLAHGEVFRLYGRVTDDAPLDATIEITPGAGSDAIATTATADKNGMWSATFEGLSPGEHLLNVAVTDARGLAGETISVQIEILPPEEDVPAITALPAQLMVEEGEVVIARASISHASLETCSTTWSDSQGTLLVANVVEGIAMVNLGQAEESFSGTFTVTCGVYTQLSANATVIISLLETGPADSDGDGLSDDVDACPESSVSFTSDPSNDLDGDGCHDLREDTDDDGDGRPDSADLCPRGHVGWSSLNISADRDEDGCYDAGEDLDDDGDTILDTADRCPLGTPGWTSTGASDYDRDGCKDATDDDDDDNDSILDTDDACPTGVIGWTPTTETDYDGDGCRDSDEDGDDDADGVFDWEDQCPQTNLSATQVNEFGCAPYEWDDDGDGVMDDVDQCAGTPDGLEVNEVGCADLDGDGIFANVDQCADTPARWTPDAVGCAVIQTPVAWDTGPYSTDRFGKVGDFTIATKHQGNWVMSRDWDGESNYIFIFNQDSSSYMSSLWSQNVGRLLNQAPLNTHVFFGSFDSDWANDIAGMESRVNSYRNTAGEARADWVGTHVHYINQQGGSIGGSLGGVISSWSTFYYGIDNLQQWREIGSLYNWAGTHSVQYRFDYIAKMGQQFNAEFPIEMRRHDPGVTAVDVMVGHRHPGGWGGGHWSTSNGTFPDAATMAGFNTMEIYMHHGCSEHRDRYQKGDGSYGGCHEWDYSQYLKICDEVGNTSSCGTEFGYWITTYGREGRWLTDISSRLYELKDGGDFMFRYQGANGGWLNVTVLLSTWDDDGLRPDSAELAFNGGAFRGQYNNESVYKRAHTLNIPAGTEKVEIYAVITGHGFGKDDANCAEFCNHEHRFSMNGHVTQEDFPMAGNSSVGSDREGCAKEMGAGANANQLGSWPFGRAGWCAGQDVKPWVWDITDWIDWSGGANELRYAGLYDGVNYQPQNEQSGANQNIHANIWVVYYRNDTGVGAQFDETAGPTPSESSEGEYVAWNPVALRQEREEMLRADD